MAVCRTLQNPAEQPNSPPGTLEVPLAKEEEPRNRRVVPRQGQPERIYTTTQTSGFLLAQKQNFIG